MLKSNLNYPYPMLRPESHDYKTHYLRSSIEIKTKLNAYEIIVNLSTENNNINELLNSGQLVKGIFVKSGAVWYRRFLEVIDETPIIIDSKEIYGSVEITPCIVASTDINNFYSNDFDDDYKGINIFIRKGEIVALGNEYIYDAILESDILKNTSSIFSITKNEGQSIQHMINDEKISILLPEATYEMYNQVSKNASNSTKSMLNSMIVYPILLDIIYIISDENKKEEYSNFKWYKTLDKVIKDKVRQKVILESNLSNPLLVAQAIVPGLIHNSLIELANIILEMDNGDSV